MSYSFIRDSDGRLLGAVRDDGAFAGVTAGAEWAAAVSWNSSQTTPDDLLTHPPAPPFQDSRVPNAVNTLKAYAQLSSPSAAQMDGAIKAICILLKFLAQGL